MTSLLCPDAFLSPLEIDAAVTRALAEDLGRAGDVTSIATVPEGTRARAVVVARKAGTMSGLPLVEGGIAQARPEGIDHGAPPRRRRGRGETALLTIDGDARAVLSAERVALNFLGHLSGVANRRRVLRQADRTYRRAGLLHAERPRPACARWRNTRCAAAAGSITASGSTTRS
jgi:nicotinate-nucleotide pyrophosphorylase